MEHRDILILTFIGVSIVLHILDLRFMALMRGWQETQDKAILDLYDYRIADLEKVIKSHETNQVK